jgi:hypothetical protein
MLAGSPPAEADRWASLSCETLPCKQNSCGQKWGPQTQKKPADSAVVQGRRCGELKTLLSIRTYQRTKSHPRGINPLR